MYKKSRDIDEPINRMKLCRWVLDCCVIIAFVLGVLGVSAFGMWMQARQHLQVHRYCVQMSGCNVRPFLTNSVPFHECAGDYDGTASGYVSMDLANDEMRIFLVFSGLDPLTKLRIFGPLSETSSPNTSPTANMEIDVSSGFPGPSGTIDQTKGLTHSEIQAIVDNPGLYYLQLDTSTIVYPNGALRDSLGSECRISNL